jgi:glycine C-acetyltransferase/8-amino-7-oxononanoate synthase
MGSSIESHLKKKLEDLDEAGLLRKLTLPKSGGPDPKTAQFSSNDYLGLAHAPFLQEAAIAAIEKYGTGAGASRLLRGTLPPHEELEAAISRWKRAEASLVFTSGYAAALGTISAVVGKNDVVLMDKLCHASLIDGARLSGALIRVFPHNNMRKLSALLESASHTRPDARVLVLTESVFSMDGDCSPLAEIVQLKEKYGAWLMLDEAHAVGVIGEQGRGLAHELNLSGRIEIQLGTLSKALGGCGGYVCGSKPLIDWLVNKSRSFVYSTAPSPASAAVSLAAIQWLSSNQASERRAILWKNIKHFGSLIGSLRKMHIEPESAIIPIRANSTETANHWSSCLQEQGIFVPAIRYPTVAKGTERLRVTLSSNHSQQQITRLCDALGQLSALLPTA